MYVCGRWFGWERERDGEEEESLIMWSTERLDELGYNSPYNLYPKGGGWKQPASDLMDPANLHGLKKKTTKNKNKEIKSEDNDKEKGRNTSTRGNNKNNNWGQANKKLVHCEAKPGKLTAPYHPRNLS